MKIVFFSIIIFCLIVFILLDRLILKGSLKSCYLLADNVDDGIAVFDLKGRCTYINKRIKDVFNVTEKTILTQEPLCNWIQDYELSRPENYSCYHELDDGEKRQSYKLSFSHILKKNKKSAGVCCIVQNMTAETAITKIEHERATRDTLTGLYNREYFFEKVEHRLRYDRFTDYTIVVCDIVNFKLINDLFGTSFGDLVLRKVADELRKRTNDDDIYGRLFNDHFALLMPRRRFRVDIFKDAFKDSFGYLHNYAYALVCHIGVYDIEDRNIPVSVMCDRAFLALSTIKSSFSSVSAYYNDGLRKDIMKMQELMNELPLALKYRELVMYLQPQISHDGNLLGAEALIRWYHHEKGIIPPCDFIQVTEKVGMISEVDLYIWEEACKKLAEWKKKKNGMENLYISINISPKNFYVVDVYDVLTGLVEKYGISPSKLNLEITETAIIMDFERQIKLINKLRDYGFAVEMDDFGSGYSSLNMLKEIDVDVLKIDMAFLKENADHSKSRMILENIVHLAKGLGIKVVTEGVEKKEQVDFLTEAGCDIFQGFYFSKPMPVTSFERKYFK